MRRALIYGAGNIGRGFIGKILSESGYQVCFIDINKNIVNEINKRKEYPVRVVTNEDETEVVVKNVCALHGDDTENIVKEIISTDIMAVSVGVRNLPSIVHSLCEGLKARKGNKALNILICENISNAGDYLRSLIKKTIGAKHEKTIKNVGLVETSIGRMVPVMTEEMLEEDALRLRVEPYEILPVDKTAFVGKIPQIKGILPYEPFSYYVKRKLYIHNMSHALCAYMGYAEGYQYIYECAENKQIRKIAEKAMMESARAIAVEYGSNLQDLTLHIEDLLNRFGNRKLKDQVVRVAKDPIRKLKDEDRLIGAAKYCIRWGIVPENIITAIAYALNYDNKSDENAAELQNTLADKGIAFSLMKYCSLDEKDDLSKRIIDAYEKLKG